MSGYDSVKRNVSSQVWKVVRDGTDITCTVLNGFNTVYNMHANVQSYETQLSRSKCVLSLSIGFVWHICQLQTNPDFPNNDDSIIGQCQSHLSADGTNQYLAVTETGRWSWSKTWPRTCN